jgi:hypothetical protein
VQLVEKDSDKLIRKGDDSKLPAKATRVRSSSFIIHPEMEYNDSG